MAEKRLEPFPVPDPPKYERATKWATLGMAPIVILALVSGVLTGGGLVGSVLGIFVALFEVGLLVGLPIAFWGTILGATDQVLKATVSQRRFEKVLRKFRVKVPTEMDLMLTRPNFPRSSTWRVWQTVSIVFGAASTVTPRLPFPHNPLTESATFFLVAFTTLAFGVPIIVGFLWVLEDAGLRRIDTESSVISKIGTPVEGVFVGVGSAVSFANFVLSVQGGIEQAVAVAFALLLLLLPCCSVVTVFFHTGEFEQSYSASKVVGKFLESSTAKRIPLREVVLRDS